MDYQKKRKRISKACNFCRKRKIKCDGLKPCWNCQQDGIEICTYVESTNRSSKCENKERSELFEQRLSRVESLIERLNYNFRINNTEETSVNILNNYNPSAPRILNQTQSSINSGPSRGEMEISNLCDNLEEQNNDTKRNIDSTDPNGATKLDLEQLSGSQFNYCRFSSKFIEQLKEKLPENEHDLLFPFEKMQTTFSELGQKFELRWTEVTLINQRQRDQLLLGIFHSDHCFVMTLLEQYYERNLLASYICTLGELKELFGGYYKINGFKTRKLEESELLIMNITLAMSVYAKLDEMNRFRVRRDLGSISKDNAITVENLKSMHDEYFTNSIFYYHRIMILNDGFQTIRALLLLLIYAEYNISNSQVDRVLLCLAIRYAQDSGLQRLENFCHLPKHQVVIRQRVWCLLEYFDVEMAFRKGRPPTLNILDDEDLTWQVSLESSHSFDQTFYTFTKRLTRLRNKSYSLLLNCSFLSFKEFCNSLDNLNKEMLNLATLFPLECRPLLINDQNFDTIANSKDPLRQQTRYN